MTTTIVTYWGPLFPDRNAARFTAPAVAAQLVLGNPTTAFDGPLEGSFARARAPGVAGDAITLKFAATALTGAGELHEDEIAKTVEIRFSPDDTTGADVAALFAASALLELAGTFDATGTLRADDDEFGPTNLGGGADAYNSRVTYWGPLFPDRALSVVDPALVAGVGPEGAAQFALALEGGFSVSWEWITDVFKAYDGRERRASVLSRPRQTYKGSAHLVGDTVVKIRALIERYAALGSTFLLGLAHESAMVVGELSPDGLMIALGSTAMLDWAVPGQRCAVIDGEGRAVQPADDLPVPTVVIQSVASDAVTVDRPFDVGFDVVGCELVPLAPVILDAQQGFARFPVPAGEAQGVVETWAIAARGTGFGFRSADVPARLALVGLAADLPFVVLAARTPGAVGNSITVEFQEDAASADGEIFEDVAARTVLVKFLVGFTTAANVKALFDTSSLVAMTGEWVDSTMMQAPDDVFGPTNLAGGADGAEAAVGRGATIATYFGRPLFDRGVDVETTVDESVQTMSEIVDLGAAPQVVGTADAPDWGRRLAMSRVDLAEFQWLKKFLWTIRGRWKTFWLPTHRADLVAIGDGPGSGGATGSITIDSAIGDFAAWYPSRRSDILVEQGDAMYYLHVDSAIDNGDGTTTITVRINPDDPFAVLPTAEPIDSISWLELVRLEDDAVSIAFSGGGFALDQHARAVQR